MVLTPLGKSRGVVASVVPVAYSPLKRLSSASQLPPANTLAPEYPRDRRPDGRAGFGAFFEAAPTLATMQIALRPRAGIELADAASVPS